MRALSSAFFALALLALASGAHAQPLIVIDAGHGGTDPGAVGCSLEEANVVLDVALRLRTELEAAGIRVALTRDVDEFVGLSARASFANSMSADGFVSIHSNANSGTPASGTETWIANAAGARSLSLATLIQTEMVRVWGLPDRGVKRADFVVVRDTTMPAALTELAFTNRCSPDGMLLGSETERQAMAEAQARAVLEWLGVMPGINGTLRGVVFEDQGMGTMDLSVRLPGATVRVVETGATASADAAEAAWLFDLPAGTYTVEASAPGHRTATRSCDVTSGGTTWCSIGLFPDAAPADAARPDAAALEDDAGSSESPDASASPDASGVARPDAGGCACRAASPRPWSGLATSALALLGAILVLRRRARRVGAPWALGIGASALAVSIASCASEGGTETALTEPSEPAGGAIVAPSAVIAGEPARVLDEREVLLHAPDGATLVAPLVSPDGTTLLASRADQSALYAWRSDTPTAVVPICARAGCGHEPRFFADGLVATRTPEQASSAVPGDAYTLAGQPSTSRMGAGGALAWVEGEDAVRVRVDGETHTLARGEERFIRAELSPDRRHVVAWGLRSGVTLHRLSDGVRFALGGGSPHFDPEGRLLVLDRTEDEGHTLTAGDIAVVELTASPILHVVPDTGRIAHSPSISRMEPDGTATLAYEREGALVLARIALR